VCLAIGNEGTSSNDIDSDIMNSLTAQSTSDSVLFSNEQNDNWIRKLAKKKKSRQLDSCIQQVRDSCPQRIYFFQMRNEINAQARVAGNNGISNYWSSRPGFCPVW